MEELQKQIDALKAEIDSLKSSTTIPFEIGGAFEERIGAVKGSPSSEDPALHSQTINEGGVSTVYASEVMDGFITIVVNNIPRKIPYYN